MGQPINPKLCEGQIEGGMGQGIDAALWEEIVIENGSVINPTFTDYKFPSSLDMPTNENSKSMMAPVPHRDGPFGAKGLGEGILISVAPAVGNAAYTAVGVRITDIPITKEKILKALAEQR